MKSDFEYMNYSENERLAMLETRAAEIERMLGSAAPEQAEAPGVEAPDYPASAVAYSPPGGYPEEDEYADAFEYPQDAEPAEFPGEARGGRTEILINRGRRNVRPGRLGFARAHWKALAVAASAVALLSAIVSAVIPGGSPAWPASVSRMQSEITAACENPNVAAEPSQLNFACAKDTRQILWIFALLTSGGNPAYVDPSTGRKGLEPITPGQGGDVAWSLNLHAPYDPASAIDSLQVAARAINNIIGGATLTNASGMPSVQGGLESSPANCQRYTGSPALVKHAGYPAVCAHPVSGSSGQQALVSDVFRQWMVGAPAQLSSDAAVLFVNASNPASPQVRQILGTLPGSGL